MIPVFQTLYGGPDSPSELQGNCLQASLASLFEVTLEEIPHFIGLYGDDGWIAPMDQWLSKNYGLGCMTVLCDKENYPHGYALMGGPSKPSGIQHVVVCYEGKQVHNPLGEEREIEPEVYWIFYKLDPSKAVSGGERSGKGAEVMLDDPTVTVEPISGPAMTWTG